MGQLVSRRRGGVAAVEFAIIVPLLMLVLASIVVWGGWLWLAQGVQSLASESARAALGGLDATERRSLARAYVADQGEAVVGLPAERAVVDVTSNSSVIRVDVRYDVAGHPILILSSLTPSPPQVITRTAIIRTGGY
ncbi:MULTISPECIES: TadE/TadG family type IV pilus assembly protein [Brevundimonas]|uniref:TadE/TadG family type IV pilus assembly protein n=1 Tax=Brevundimonas TaxID=41275 RepID=UPI000F033231|nr:TadE/TadG family type IV pilus assembly protein [Brevundimonas lutea]